jgi:hypothetical protein
MSVERHGGLRWWEWLAVTAWITVAIVVLVRGWRDDPLRALLIAGGIVAGLVIATWQRRQGE